MSNALETPNSRLRPSTTAAKQSSNASTISNERRRWPAHGQVFGLLLALRVANALAIRTFFQPDEYFQSLEPAWQLAFGTGSGAWITWEWKAHLRSSLHPVLFTAVYQTAEATAKAFSLSATNRAELLVAAPKLCQAFFAALADYYTLRLAETAYGPESPSAIATLALTVVSPWQWFCSTRTLSNSLETTLSVIALSLWPWSQVRPSGDVAAQSSTHPSKREPTPRGEHVSSHPGPTTTYAIQQSGAHAPNTLLSLLLAAAACTLRPTNALIWLPVGASALLDARSWSHRGSLIRTALICGCVVTAIAALSDRLYYGGWVLPPLNFLYFNVAKDLAVFYGRNRADYYVTEGLPLLLTTALPFAIAGVWTAVRRRDSQRAPNNGLKHGPAMLSLFAWTTLAVTAAMSLIAHKEVRFLYPLLPMLHVLCGGPLATFFARPLKASRKLILSSLLLANFSLALYITQYHQRGVIDVTQQLRTIALEQPHRNVSVAFLMPCHSTPWRSHLVAQNLHAWALTCEPPLDVPLLEREGYLDEADQFYADPKGWLARNMVERTVARSDDQVGEQRVWPDYLVFFEKLEETMGSYASVGDGWGYVEYWRGFNTHFHDDWRRNGDVVVWKRKQLS